jgi:hypothetical protein
VTLGIEKLGEQRQNFVDFSAEALA